MPKKRGGKISAGNGKFANGTANTRHLATLREILLPKLLSGELSVTEVRN